MRERRLLLAVALGATGLVLAGADSSSQRPQRSEGLEAFGRVAAVLRHPRCLNCHTTTSFPRQGDDRHPHANLVRRGETGEGAAGLPCSTCHGTSNNAASGIPGRPNWHLAPLSMGWEGLSDGALCRALKDPSRNGNRSLAALTEHLASDPLVSYGWDPGAGRTPVPTPREELKRWMKRWIAAGAPCPAP